MISADLPPLRQVIARHGLMARRALGQHFLLDLNLTGRIARAAGDLAQGTTIEVGPGPGGLTRALLDAGARRIVAIEKDPRCRAALDELAVAADGRLEVIEGDARKIDLARLGEPPRHLVANLPYNVSTVLLIDWLARIAEAPSAFAGLTLMFQMEVALRLVAEGDLDPGALVAAAGFRDLERVAGAAFGQQGLRPALDHGGVAVRGAPVVRGTGPRLHAGAQGDLDPGALVAAADAALPRRGNFSHS